MYDTFLWDASLWGVATTVTPIPIPLPEQYLRDFMNDELIGQTPNEN